VPDLTELRIVWCVLGAITAMAAGLLIPGGLPFALLPWMVGLALLAGPTGGAVHAGLRELLGKTPGRMAILAMIALVLLVAVLTNIGIGLVFCCWIAAVSLVASAVLRPARFGDLFVNLTLSATVLVGLGGLLEAGLRVPALARRFGTPQERARWERAYDHVEEQNVFHLRSRHATIPRQPGVRRILAIGDSFTWGDKIVTTDSLWPTLLEAALSSDSSRPPTEVVNLSQRAWNTVQEVAALDRLGWQFSPDWVIVQFFINDAEVSRVEREGVRAKVRTAVQPQLQRSALLWVVKRFGDGYLRKGAIARNYFRLYRDDAPGWQRMREALREMADSSRARAVPVTVLLYPDFIGGSWTPATYPYAAIYRKVADEARAAGLDVLDLTPVFAAQGGDWSRWWATQYDRHPSPAAQLVAARAMATHLDTLGWPNLTGPATLPASR
jgi:lysophospholipase L1-like esterase